MPDPNQTDPNTNQVPTPGIPSSDPNINTQPAPDFQSADSTITTPVMPVDGQNTSTTTPVDATTEDVKTPEDQGSSAPPDIPPMTSSPKKKFGGGKIIATILGFLVLAGGIAGGVILTQQQQDIREKASGCADIGNPADRQACFAGLGGSGSGGGSGGSTCFSDCYQGGASGNTPGECNAICNAQSGGGGGSGGSSGGGSGETGSGQRPNCPSGQTYCTDSCYNTQTSSKNCGSCGSACPLTYSCSGGSCVPPAGCTTDNDCPINNGSGNHYDCQNSKCQVDTSGIPGACASNNDCIDGKTCVNKQCVVAGANCSAIVDTDGSINLGAAFSNTCQVVKVRCANNLPPGTPCDEAHGGTIVGYGSSASFSGCGTEQIDIDCSGCGYTSGTGKGFKSRFNQGQCASSTTTTPTGDSPTASCQNIKAYTETWTLLTATQLSQSKVGDKVNFCVAGTTTQGTFDRARFAINNVMQAETTSVRPSSTDFCQLYTIPTGITTFSIGAGIHHATLGWR